jgi:membrane protein implicated in regulation of membrane protease activity
MGDFTALEYFFMACAVVGGVLFLFRLALFFLGGGDTDVDADVPGGDGSFDDTDDSFRFLSVQSLSAFFLMFGLVGLALLREGVQEFVAIIAAVAAGVFTVWVVSQIFVQMKRLQSDGTIRTENAIGQEGTVYLTIPSEGSGQVQVVVQGGLRMFDAVSADHQKIPTGTHIRVVKIVSGKVLVVEKI